MEAERGPSPRRAAAAVLDKDNKLWIVGGGNKLAADDSEASTQDVWVFDSKNSTWEEMGECDPFIPRQEHNCFFYKGILFVVGGVSALTGNQRPPLLQVWAAVEAESLVNRKSASALVGDRVFFYGGIKSVTVFETIYSTDLVILDLRTKVVTAAETKGEKPSPRHPHIAAVRKKLYLFSGMDGNSYTTDNKLHILDTESLSWSEVRVTGSPPMPRMFHAFTSYRNKLYVFGGQGFNDLHEFDTEKLEWNEIATTGDVPTPRMYSSLCVSDKFIYLFGGSPRVFDNGCDELLILNREDNRWIRVFGNPLPFVAASTGYLEVNQLFSDILKRVASGENLPNETCNFETETAEEKGNTTKSNNQPIVPLTPETFMQSSSFGSLQPQPPQFQPFVFPISQMPLPQQFQPYPQYTQPPFYTQSPSFTQPPLHIESLPQTQPPIFTQPLPMYYPSPLQTQPPSTHSHQPQ